MIYKIRKDMSVKDITLLYRAKITALSVACIGLTIHSMHNSYFFTPKIAIIERLRIDTVNQLTVLRSGLTEITVDRNHNIPTFCNNPGNIRPGNKEIDKLAIGTIESVYGKYLYFPNKELGFKALKILLLKNYPNHTLQQCIEKFAPPSENNTSQYVATLTKHLQCSPNTLIKNCDISKLMKAIAKIEGFKS
jgi:hypothetical protein